MRKAIMGSRAWDMRALADSAAVVAGSMAAVVVDMEATARVNI